MTKKGFIGLIAGFGITVATHLVVTTLEQQKRQKETNGRFILAGKIMEFHSEELNLIEKREGRYGELSDLMTASYHEFHTTQILRLVDVMTTDGGWFASIEALAEFHWKTTTLAKIPGYIGTDQSLLEKITALNTDIFEQYGTDLGKLTQI